MPEDSVVFRNTYPSGDRLPAGFYLGYDTTPGGNTIAPQKNSSAIALIVPGTSQSDYDLIKTWGESTEYCLAFIPRLPGYQDCKMLAADLILAAEERASGNPKRIPLMVWVDQGLNVDPLSDPRDTFSPDTSVWLSVSRWLRDGVSVEVTTPFIDKLVSYLPIANLGIPLKELNTVRLDAKNLQLDMGVLSPKWLGILAGKQGTLPTIDSSVLVDLSSRKLGEKSSGKVGSFHATLKNLDLDLLDVGLKYHAPKDKDLEEDGSIDEDNEEKLQTYEFRVFNGIRIDIPFLVHPTDLFNSQLNLYSQILSLETTFRTVNNTAVYLSPTKDSFLTPVRQPIDVLSNPHHWVPFYFAPAGRFNIVEPGNSTDKTVRPARLSDGKEIVCGLTGTETLSVPKAQLNKSHPSVEFVSGKPAVFEKKRPPKHFAKKRDQNVDNYTLTGKRYTVPYLKFSGGSSEIAYRLQPVQSSLFDNREKSSSENTMLKYKPLTLLTVPELNTVPMVPFAGLRLPSKIFEQKTPEDYAKAEMLCSRVLSKHRAETLRDQRRKLPPSYFRREGLDGEDSYGISPQGWLCRVAEGRANSIQSIVLSRRSYEIGGHTHKEDILLDCTNPPLFNDVWLDRELFAVVTEDKIAHLKFNSGSTASIFMNAWKFDFKDSGTAESKSYVIIKSSKHSIEELIANPSTWMTHDLLAPAATNERIASELKSYFDKLVNGTDEDKALFVDVIKSYQNKTWNGLLFINPMLDFSGGSSGIDVLLAGDKLYGDLKGTSAIGLNTGKAIIDADGASLNVEDTSIFAAAKFIRAEEPSHDRQYDGTFRLMRLAGRFANSHLQNFDAELKLIAARLFDDDSDGAENPAKLKGTYQFVDGNDVYSFKSESDIALKLPANGLVNEVHMTQIVFRHISESNTSKKKNYFGVGGYLTFSKAVTDFELLDFERLVFDGIDFLIPEIGFPHLKFDLSRFKIDIKLSKILEKGFGFLRNFPLRFKDFLIAKVHSGAVRNHGFIEISPGGPDFKYGLVFELDLGSLGAMLAKSSIKVDVLVGWVPKSLRTRNSRVAVGIRFPNWSGGSVDLGVQGVLNLRLAKFAFHSGEGFIAIQALGCQLDVIGRKLELDLYLVTGGNSKVGWIANVRSYKIVLGQRMKIYQLRDAISVRDAVEKLTYAVEKTAGDSFKVEKIVSKSNLCTPSSDVPIVYCANNEWTAGGDLEEMFQCLKVQFIFDDPGMYGARVVLSKTLYPIDVDVLYKRVSDHAGVYTVTVPLAGFFKAIPRLNFTLPSVGVSVYTSGDWVFDFGYPEFGDFSHSFSLSVPPFGGSGGFKFGKVPGTKPNASRILLGIGAEVFWGGSIDFTVVSGTLKIAVFALLELRIPIEQQSANFAWRGTIGIYGLIKGYVSLGIISGSTSLKVLAMVTYDSETGIILLDTIVEGYMRIKIGVGSCAVYVGFDFSFGFSYTWETKQNSALYAQDRSDYVLSIAKRSEEMVFRPDIELGERLNADLALVPYVSCKATMATSSSANKSLVGAALPALIYKKIELQPVARLNTKKYAKPSEINKILYRLSLWCLSAIKTDCAAKDLPDKEYSKSEIDALISMLKDSAKAPINYHLLDQFLSKNFLFTLKVSDPDNQYETASFPMSPDYHADLSSHAFTVEQFRAKSYLPNSWFDSVHSSIAQQFTGHENQTQNPHTHNQRPDEELLCGYISVLMLGCLNQMQYLFNSEKEDGAPAKPKPKKGSDLLAFCADTATENKVAAQIFQFAGRQLLSGLITRPDPNKEEWVGLYENTGAQVNLPTGDLKVVISGLPNPGHWFEIENDLLHNGFPIDANAVPKLADLNEEWFPDNASGTQNSILFLSSDPDDRTPCFFEEIGKTFDLQSSSAYKLKETASSSEFFIFEYPQALNELINGSPLESGLGEFDSKLEQCAFIALTAVKIEEKLFEFRPIKEQDRRLLNSLVTLADKMELTMRLFAETNSQSTLDEKVLLGLKAPAKLVRANVSTESNPPEPLTPMNIPGSNKIYPFVASQDDKENFLMILYALGVVNSPGFYLNLPDDSTFAAPDEPFNIWLLVQPKNALQEMTKGFNAIVKQDSKDQAINCKTAQQPNWTNIVDPGTFPIVVARPAPIVPDGKVENKDLLRQMYGLLGFEVLESNAFQYRQFPLPATPTTATKKGFKNVKDDWQMYTYALDLSHFAKNSEPVALMESVEQCKKDVLMSNHPDDPYKWIGETLNLRLHFRDILGNRPYDPNNKIPVRKIDQLKYTDELLPLSKWPGLTSGFRLVADSNQIEVILSFDAGKIQNDHKCEAIRAYERIIWQLAERPSQKYAGTKISLINTLHLSEMENAANSNKLRDFAWYILHNDKGGKKDERRTAFVDRKVSLFYELNTPITKDAIKHFKVYLQMARDTRMVDPVIFSRVPAIGSIQCQLSPTTSSNFAQDTWEFEVKDFAIDFETIYNRDKAGFVLATGYGSENASNPTAKANAFAQRKKLDTQKELWAVSTKVFPTEVKKVPEFFCQSPIVRGPWSGVIDIDASTKISFENSDTESALNSVLDSLETILSPQNIRKILLLPAKPNDDPGSAKVTNLLKKKVELAEILADRLTPLLKPGEHGEISEYHLSKARQSYRQELLRDLRNSFKTDSVAQIYLSTNGNITKESCSPRIFGQVIEVQQKKTIDVVSRAKLPLKELDDKALSSLEFSIPTADKTGDTAISKNLFYRMSHLEHQITRDTRSPGSGCPTPEEDVFVNSHWLNFVFPVEYPLGIVEIPIPDRRIPACPHFGLHTADVTGSGKLDKSELDPIRAGQWDYVFKFDVPYPHRDESIANIYLSSDHNVRLLKDEGMVATSLHKFNWKLKNTWKGMFESSNFQVPEFEEYCKHITDIILAMKSDKTNDYSAKSNETKISLLSTERADENEITWTIQRLGSFDQDPPLTIKNSLGESISLKKGQSSGVKKFHVAIANRKSEEYTVYCERLRLIRHNVASCEIKQRRNQSLVDSRTTADQHILYSASVSSPSPLSPVKTVSDIVNLHDGSERKAKLEEYLANAFKEIFGQTEYGHANWFMQATWYHGFEQFTSGRLKGGDIVRLGHLCPVGQTLPKATSPSLLASELAEEMGKNWKDKNPDGYFHIELNIYRNEVTGPILLKLEQLRLPFDAITR